MTDITTMFSLEGRTALVTGAGTGMGCQIAKTLSAAGARVICAARRLEMVESVAASIRESGGEAIGLSLDIASTDSVTTVFDEAQEKFGSVDVLVNAAAQLDFAPFPGIDDEAWTNLINVNFTGTMRMCREFSKRLLDAGKPGSIINITSVTGMQVLKNVPCYGSIKAAVNQLTKQIAADLFNTGIRCNAIAPGYFLTEMVAEYFETDQGKEEIARLPSKRVGQVEELSGVVLLLASNASSFINGAVIPVDDGQVLQLA